MFIRCVIPIAQVTLIGIRSVDVDSLKIIYLLINLILYQTMAYNVAYLGYICCVRICIIEKFNIFTLFVNN